MPYQILEQTRPNNCGQTVVAMLTGKSIAEVEKAYGHFTTTYNSEHIRVVNSFGFYTEGYKIHANEPLPPLALVRIARLKCSGGHVSTTGKVKKGGHLLLWADGKFMDPASGMIVEQLPDTHRITHVAEVLAP